MTRKFLHNLEILDPEVAAPLRGGVLVANGRVVEVLAEAGPRPESAELIDLAGFSLAPGMLDLHFHGELILFLT